MGVGLDLKSFCEIIKPVRSQIRAICMQSNVLNENQYFNLVASIALLNDCKLLDIDFADQQIHLYGKPAAVRSCHKELEALLGRQSSAH